MYKAIKDKEHIAIGGVLLATATQEQLRRFYELGHSYVEKVAKPKKKKESEEKAE